MSKIRITHAVVNITIQVLVLCLHAPSLFIFSTAANVKHQKCNKNSNSKCKNLKTFTALRILTHIDTLQRTQKKRIHNSEKTNQSTVWPSLPVINRKPMITNTIVMMSISFNFATAVMQSQKRCSCRAWALRYYDKHGQARNYMTQ